MPLPQPRPGRVLRIKDRPLEFSFWPMERTTRRYGLGTRVFATDAWTVIRRSAERRCLAAQKNAAFALLGRVEDFYRASESGVKAAKPRLLYYCFMNLAKAFVLTCRRRQDVNNAQHGLAERIDLPPNDRELVNAYLNAFQTVAAGPLAPAGENLNNFDELLLAISGNGVPANPHRYDLPVLLPQVVPGHGLWVEGTRGVGSERFFSVEKIEFYHDAGPRHIWLRLFVFADDLRRVGVLPGGHLVLTDRVRLGHAAVARGPVPRIRVVARVADRREVHRHGLGCRGRKNHHCQCC